MTVVLVKWFNGLPPGRAVTPASVAAAQELVRRGAARPAEDPSAGRQAAVDPSPLAGGAARRRHRGAA